ncbi:uncharacterized protein LOC127258394 [Andrographis paniculata]|uniref:uncharacterized protein LOC127258394 n=1 Tax=Andrographis paniculata TaxID=175694 RepID=UPI0021E7DF22|nr:uncharacterized protein LOC127258394 [Andrographis paniculata]
MIGEGKVKYLKFQDGEESDWIKIPEQFLFNDGDNNINSLMTKTYPNLLERYKDSAYLKERAILAPKNEDVDEINSIMVSMIPAGIRKYYSADTVAPGEAQNSEQHLNPPKLLNMINLFGFPNHFLELKEGTPIILLRNINQSLGLCNRTQLTIPKLGDKVLEARIISGSHVGEEVLIPRIILTTTQT